ncbi:MAG: rod shape-determining protein MreD [Treponema sp.]|nr:rod shape-determining protein MreD [Treponema sp.]
MAKNVIWTVVFVFVAAILQSTLLSHIAFHRAVPDLALGILVYTAYINGLMTGQVSGFFSGVMLDLISAAPMGLNALVRTIIGALAGLIKGKVILDFFLVPMVLCAAATLLKAALLFLLSLVFQGAVPAYPLAAPTLWAELALNTLSAPVLFAFLRRFNILLVGKGVA